MPWIIPQNTHFLGIKPSPNGLWHWVAHIILLNTLVILMLDVCIPKKVRHPIPHIKHPAETMMDAGDIRETMGDHAQRGTTGMGWCSPIRFLLWMVNILKISHEHVMNGYIKSYIPIFPSFLMVKYPIWFSYWMASVSRNVFLMQLSVQRQAPVGPVRWPQASPESLAEMNVQRQEKHPSIYGIRCKNMCI